MTDELQPRPEPEPLPDPVVEDLDDEDEDADLAEPLGAVRLSPYAVSAFVFAALGGWGLSSLISIAVNVVSFGGPNTSREFIRALAPLMAPLALGGIALWLSYRGEDEIIASDGKLGGVGFARSARVVAMVVIVIASLAAIASLLMKPVSVGTG
jgi:hypothetical protein